MTPSRHIAAAWLDGPVRALADRFDGLADEAALAERAEAVLGNSGWIAAMLSPLIDALRADPWFEPPLRCHRDPSRTAIVLVDNAMIGITAWVTIPGAVPLPAGFVVTGRTAITHYVRGGSATLRQWRAPPARSDFSAAAAEPCTELPALAIDDGMTLRHDGHAYGHLIVPADDAIVGLTATIKPGSAPLAREYAVSDGRLLRAASADQAASRMEMLLTFLRTAGHIDGADAFDLASRHPAFHLRWAAMREWLMLDASGARPRLADMAAADPHSEVRAAAARTLTLLNRRLAPDPAPAPVDRESAMPCLA